MGCEESRHQPKETRCQLYLATEVFHDPLALTLFDEDETSNDTVTVRVISARPATIHEIQQYESGD